MSGPTPWLEVRRALDGPTVAVELGLRPARERGKYGCVRCDSSDALHVYADGAHCYSCGWHGTAIDLAAAAWRLEPAEACRRLAERYGIRPDPMYQPSRLMSRPRSQGPDRDVVRYRAEVYGDLVARTTLGSRGRRYLEGRGLSADLADVHGMRSTTSPEHWRATWTDLERTHGAEAMTAAGLWRERRPWYPWGSRVPALLLPYYDLDGQIVAIRWRRIDDGTNHRYMTPLGAPAPIPWGAEVADGPCPLELVIVEGELDGLAARMGGYDSMALGGTTPCRELLAWLVEHVADVDGLALWLDDDAAGLAAARRIVQALARRYGAPWVVARVRRWRSAADPAETIGGAA